MTFTRYPKKFGDQAFLRSLLLMAFLNRRKQRIRTGLLVGLWLSLALLTTAPALADDRFAGCDAYIEAAIKKWDVPGVGIAVVKDGKVVQARGNGVADPWADRAAKADTVFPIATCTKSFNAACIAMLVDEGKVQWDHSSHFQNKGQSHRLIVHSGRVDLQEFLDGIKCFGGFGNLKRLPDMDHLRSHLNHCH